MGYEDFAFSLRDLDLECLDARKGLADLHRLNAVMSRRIKADACTTDGSPLFARLRMNTESFLMGPG